MGRLFFIVIVAVVGGSLDLTHRHGQFGAAHGQPGQLDTDHDGAAVATMRVTRLTSLVALASILSGTYLRGSLFASTPGRHMMVDWIDNRPLRR